MDNVPTMLAYTRVTWELWAVLQPELLLSKGLHWLNSTVVHMWSY